MTQRLLIAIMATLFYAPATMFAQKDVPAFGKVEKADLEMKTCSFDDAAEAMVLFDVGEVYCSLNLMSLNSYNFLRTTLSKHVRIKILNEKGLDRANIRIRYRSDHSLEDIVNLTAQTINLDASGNIVYTKVDKSQVFRKKLNKRYSEVIFTFPEVKKGSIIEYKYEDEADGFYALKSWYFQRSIPVKYSRYTMNFPYELILTGSEKGALPIEVKNQQKSDRNLQTYSMRDVPALRDEAYITCDEDYLQQVIPVLTAVDIAGQPRKDLIHSWPTIIKALMEDEDFGTQLKKNIPRTSDLDAMLVNVKDPYSKMNIIYNYVRKNMQWNEYYGIWALEGVKSAWKDKKGTSGEINLILVNLLKDAGINVHPVLVSTRENGRVNTGMPDYEQFNKVMAYVEINKHPYVLDATNKYAPVDIIPSDVMYSEGMVIEEIETGEGGWKVLWNEDKSYKNVTALIGKVNEDGSMKGEATVISSDYSRLERMPVLKKGKEQFMHAYFRPEGFVRVDSVSVENEDIDSLPLNQHVQFTAQTSGSGDYHYFSANLFTGLEKNPFLSDNRASDVFFGASQKYMLLANFTLPAGYKFDELPRNIKMIMPDTSIIFSRTMAVEGNQVAVEIKLDIKKPFYSVEEYPYFKEFYKKLFEMVNEQLVYKKI